MAAGLEELFRVHWPLVHGYLARRTGDAGLAEELAQETFYRATRAFLGYRGGSAAAWLLSIARHVLVDELRRDRRLVPLPESLAAAAGAQDERIALAEVLGVLPREQRRLLELVYVYGFSHREVAAMSGSSEGAVRTAVWRAREAFRAAFAHAEAAAGATTEAGR